MSSQCRYLIQLCSNIIMTSLKLAISLSDVVSISSDVVISLQHLFINSSNLVSTEPSRPRSQQWQSVRQKEARRLLSAGQAHREGATRRGKTRTAARRNAQRWRSKSWGNLKS